MKIVSWNINGWRARLNDGNFDEMMKTYDPDIVCLQEIKINKDFKIEYDGYTILSHIGDKPGYSGTAFLFKKNTKLGNVKLRRNKTEGRLMLLEMQDNILINVYVQNSGQTLSRLAYRVDEWDKNLIKMLQKLQKPVLLVGDMNVARTKNDINKEQKNSAGYTLRERESFEDILNKTGLIDIWRKMHPNTVEYSYWTYYHHARKQNKGWRIDYALTSPDINVKKCEILSNIMGSDHAPILVEI